MTLFVGGPYDGEDLPYNPYSTRRVRLPDANSNSDMESSDSLGSMNTADAEWPHQYEDFRPVPERDVSGFDASPFVNQLVAFADAIERGAEPPSSVRENVNTVATLHAIRQSMRSGKAEKVATG